MSHLVGTKGQVVIEKEIRDQLGVQPGWIAVQKLVQDHVEISFIPPEHTRSLKGSLAAYTRIRVGEDEEWERARAKAWRAAARDKSNPT